MPVLRIAGFWGNRRRRSVFSHSSQSLRSIGQRPLLNTIWRSLPDCAVQALTESLLLMERSKQGGWLDSSTEILSVLSPSLSDARGSKEERGKLIEVL